MKTTQPTATDGPFLPTFESLESVRVPDWYVDGKFGIFIHWGLYAVPAEGNEWYAHAMYTQDSPEHRSHLRRFGPPAQFGYKDFIPRFKAARYDPAQWADLFRRAGARFVVPVAEHHDGFAMYDTALSRWSAARMGPRRDLIGDLASAVRAAGLTFGLSSHRAEHWWFFNPGTRFPSDVSDPRYAGLYGPAKPRETQPDKAFLDDWLLRCCELVDAYRPQLFWFDWWIEQAAFKPYLKKFAAYYYNRGAQWGLPVAINYKNDAYSPRAAVYDVERGQLADIRPLFWQTDTSVGKKSWGYIRNEEFKTPAAIIGDLADIVSKNGALLLNIGPRADGTIPGRARDILLAIGRWLNVNGEAIYATRPWKVFGEGPTTVPGGGFTDTQRADYTARDIRFTARGQDTLYAIVLAWPANGRVVIRSLGSGLRLYAGRIAAVDLLGSRQPVRWSRGAGGLVVRLPAAAPCAQACVLRITRAAP